MSAVRRPSSVAVADQAVASGSNFLVVVLAGRNLDVDAFSAFALGLALVLISQGIVNAFSGEVLLLRRHERFDAARAGPGAALLIGVPLGAVALATGIVMGSAVVCAAGIALPVVALQYVYRAVFSTEGQLHRVLLNDIVYGSLQIGLVFTALNLFNAGPAAVFVAWSIAAAAACLLAVVQIGVAPHLRSGRTWLETFGRTSSGFALEYCVTTGASYTVLLLTPLVTVPTAVAGLRIMQSIFGFLNVGFQAVQLFLLPAVAQATESRRGRTLTAASAVLAVCVVTWTSVVLLIPDDLGVGLFGPSWAASEGMPAWFGLEYLGLVAYSIGYLALRLRGRFSLVRRVRLVYAVLVLALPLALGHAFGGVGVAAGLAVAAVCVGVVLLPQLRPQQPPAPGGADR